MQTSDVAVIISDESESPSDDRLQLLEASKSMSDVGRETSATVDKRPKKCKRPTTSQTDEHSGKQQTNIIHLT